MTLADLKSVKYLVENNPIYMLANQSRAKDYWEAKQFENCLTPLKTAKLPENVYLKYFNWKQWWNYFKNQENPTICLTLTVTPVQVNVMAPSLWCPLGHKFLGLVRHAKVNEHPEPPWADQPVGRAEMWGLS